ncbi:MAG: hypothetical protein QF376_05255 [Anaerolineales bacterium]|nr:hypothetical protein [Anaerolineales bacterium]HJO33045.1 hypothetical protein [Anaerolineales bacterium]
MPQAAVEATEKAVVNSLTADETVVGCDENVAHALPVERMQEGCARALAELWFSPED